MGWFSKKEEVVETPEQKKQKYLDSQFEKLQEGQLFNCSDTFAIFNKKTGNIISYDDNTMFCSVEKVVEVKGLLLKEKKMDIDMDLVIIKVKRISFQIV